MALENNRLTASLDFANHQAKNIGLPLSVGYVGIDNVDGGRIISNTGGNAFLIRAENAATEASPTYSFLNNPDTGIWSDSGGGLGFSVNGTARVVLEAAREVSVEGNRITNVAPPDNGSDAATRGYVDGLGAERVLGKAEAIDLTNGNPLAVHDIYSVPVGSSHIITKIIIRNSSYSAGTHPVDPVVSFGINSDYDDIKRDFPVGFGGSSASANRSLIVYPDQGAVVPHTGSEVKLKVKSDARNYANFSVEVIVMGIEA